MTNDDILKVAREIIPRIAIPGGAHFEASESEILAFANRIGDMRLEEAAMVCEGMGPHTALSYKAMNCAREIRKLKGDK